MRIYHTGEGAYRHPRHVVNCQPGKEHPETSDFMEPGENGTMVPKLFDVTFVYGQADDVPDSLAKYLISKGIAKRTKLVLPPGLVPVA